MLARKYRIEAHLEQVQNTCGLCRGLAVREFYEDCRDSRGYVGQPTCKRERADWIWIMRASHGTIPVASLKGENQCAVEVEVLHSGNSDRQVHC